MAVAAFQGARGQGVYGLVTSLGSILVRTLFQPFEEAAFVAFSKEAGGSVGTGAADSGLETVHTVAGLLPLLPDWAACLPACQPGQRMPQHATYPCPPPWWHRCRCTLAGQGAPSRAQLQRQARLLAVLVRCIVTLGAVAAAFGPAYSHLALLLLYSKRWADTEAAAALGLYSLHLPLLAANGILESFLHSVADQRQLHANNAALVGFTAAHAALSVAAVRTAGAAGLIAADAASMLLRIAYCLVFTQRRFASTVPGFSLRQLLPSRQTVAALGAALALTSAARVALLPASSAAVQLAQRHGVSLVPPAVAQQLAGQPFAVLAGAHVAVGVACLAMVAAAIARNERSIVAEVRQLRKAGKSL